MSRSPAKTGAKSTSTKKPARVKSARSEDDVEVFLASTKHPLKKEILAVRTIILGADKKIAEGVKWNSLSFRTADYFATVNLRSIDTVQLIFHRGAKSKDGERTMSVRDPDGLIKWLSSDRCIVTVGKGDEIARNRKALTAIARDWVAAL